eukprot:Plantae.Rhodophyta-Purpureofilum_apyrenoidigerum.ctg43967.p1 GENE.Plantae.Rhodophyta-Purpureofilum_apyrenoidigerum.ctg43967~~Plantae.Rhodophyta-Purpureofilum_apyrenoidigerum.ctg43967.p1  ORF type:complete len:425 (-),score=92.16 Plantae.Rhodophyta-Purpureofilum_apyrenoidigerum.ctg43967:59-1216(-)
MSTATYSALIRSFGMVKDGKMILKLLKEMESRGLTPSLVTQAEVVQGLWCSGFAQKACEYFEMTCQQGVPPSAKGIAVVLRLYANSGHTSEDFERIEKMALQHVHENLIRLVLTEIYAKRGDEEKLSALFQSIPPEKRNFTYHLHRLVAYVEMKRHDRKHIDVQKMIDELVTTLVDDVDNANDSEIVKFMSLVPSHSEEIFVRAKNPRQGNVHAGFLSAYCDNASADIASLIRLTDEAMELNMSLSTALCLKLIAKLVSVEGWRSEQALKMFSVYSIEHLAPLRGLVVFREEAIELRCFERYPTIIPVALRYLLSKRANLVRNRDVLLVGRFRGDTSLGPVYAADLQLSETQTRNVFRIDNKYLQHWNTLWNADVKIVDNDRARA